MRQNVAQVKFLKDGPMRNQRGFNPDEVTSCEITEKVSGDSVEIFSQGEIKNPESGVYFVEVDEDKYLEQTDYLATWTYSFRGQSLTKTLSFDPVIDESKPKIDFRFC